MLYSTKPKEDFVQRLTQHRLCFQGTNYFENEFSKVLYIVTLYRKYTRALNFEKQFSKVLYLKIPLYSNIILTFEKTRPS